MGDAKEKDAKEKDAKEAKDAKEKDEKDKKEEGEKDKAKKEEPNFEMLSNPARVMKPQLRVVELGEEDAARYQPLKDVSIGGIIVVKNVSGEPCQIVEPVAVKKS